jgi:hypothetical protein
MGGSIAPGTTTQAGGDEPGEPGDSLEAIDRMEDDGSPEPEETQSITAGQNRQPAAEPRIENAPAESVVPAPEPQRVEAIPAPAARPEESAATSEPAKPASAEHVDPDSQ